LLSDHVPLQQRLHSSCKIVIQMRKIIHQFVLQGCESDVVILTAGCRYSTENSIKEPQATFSACSVFTLWSGDRSPWTRLLCLPEAAADCPTLIPPISGMAVCLLGCVKQFRLTRPSIMRHLLAAPCCTATATSCTACSTDYPPVQEVIDNRGISCIQVWFLF
jgi:hypothetical protein